MLHNSLTNYSKTLSCNGKIVLLQKPVVMGILNITPDSFYENSRVGDDKKYLSVAEKMIQDGATIIDIGGQSTRPNAELISVDEELKRVLPVVKNINKQFPEIIISVDTFYSKVAQATIDCGANIINDISGGSMDAAMFKTIANTKAAYVLMHSRGTPQTMQGLTTYNNLVDDLLHYFHQKINELKQLQFENIIIDLGFGFAKNTEQNFELLKRMKEFEVLNKPILAGLSRKSMIYKTLQTTAQNALNGTTVLNTIALQNGASILRVHDVKEAVETIMLLGNVNGVE
ncbi:MAG: hypothetical protein RI955_268 [Bacteroidota bacterium]